ncbi:sodium-independent sulfate anion transporter-like isoform X2 [Zootermopsis nevadensis]|uniref:sodium-independent sulfate anion transporter-like isoform X2 n=1 Tax=Zootermopsis nevadensis TaxID=136037 RepID=UPI000B8E915E|nr:sodium-independent sulfate anion transporter-like isoform X2 [Zootermopsis nevadensis]
MKNKSLLIRIKGRFFRHVNILNWLPRYTKEDGIGDIIAGITVGLTMMPQSIAYASLAGLSPQFGLYSAFFGSYLYVVFGTIKEVSIGPTAVMSLLTYEFVHDLGIEYMVLLTFLSGCVELVMGLLNLGFLIDFISTPVTSGFTSAYSIIIIVSQLKSLFGLRKFKTKGFIDNISKLVTHLHETKIWDTVLGISCIIFLLILRKVKDIRVGYPGERNLSKHQQKIKKSLWFISISRNTIIVLISALLAFCFEMVGPSPFILSGTIESGLPPFSLPFFSIQENNTTVTFPEMCLELGLGIIVIPVVAILANVAIAKAFVTGPSLDATQEMLTLGVCNMFGSCVRSMPTCGAFTRSAVSNASGARTPMVGLYSGTLIVLALSLLTPYFYYIPRSTLAAVLISAVAFMIDWKILKTLWRCNKRDLFLMVLTFMSCLLLGVEVGLLIGVITNMIFLLYLWARPTINIITCKTPAGSKYAMLIPDIGIMYPAVHYFCRTVNKAGMIQGNSSLPVVINCTYIKGLDYTTALVISQCHKQENVLSITGIMEEHVTSIFREIPPNCCRCPLRLPHKQGSWSKFLSP